VNYWLLVDFDSTLKLYSSIPAVQQEYGPCNTLILLLTENEKLKWNTNVCFQFFVDITKNPANIWLIVFHS